MARAFLTLIALLMSLLTQSTMAAAQAMAIETVAMPTARAFNVPFERGGSAISAADRAKLYEFASMLNRNCVRVVMVLGAPDDPSQSQSSTLLARKRAEVVASLLELAGVPRVSAGHGAILRQQSSQCALPCGTAEIEAVVDGRSPKCE